MATATATRRARKTAANAPRSATTRAKGAATAKTPRTARAKAAPVEPVVVEQAPIGVHGFREGTDLDIIATALVEGGADKKEIAEALSEQMSPTTRTGSEKNIPQRMSYTIGELLNRGYTVESHWKMVPPAGGVVMPEPGAKKAAPKGTATKAPVRRSAATKATPKGAGTRKAAAAPRKRAARAK